MFEYKTVPCPKALQVKSQKEDDAAVRSFARIMNSEAVDGWEFYSMETISVAQVSGCMSFGKSSRDTPYNMMVFRREQSIEHNDQRSMRRAYAPRNEKQH